MRFLRWNDIGRGEADNTPNTDAMNRSRQVFGKLPGERFPLHMFYGFKRIPSSRRETDSVDFFDSKRPFVRGVTRLLPVIFFSEVGLEAAVEALQDIFEIHSGFQRLGNFADLAAGPVFSEKGQCAPQARDVEQSLITQDELTLATDVDQAIVSENKRAVVFGEITTGARLTEQLAAQSGIGAIVGIFCWEQTSWHADAREIGLLEELSQFLAVEALLAPGARRLGAAFTLAGRLAFAPPIWGNDRDAGGQGILEGRRFT